MTAIDSSRKPPLLDSKELRMALSENITLLQELHDLSDSKAAEKADIPRTTFYYYKHKISFTNSVAQKIATAFNVTLEKLCSTELTKRLKEEVQNLPKIRLIIGQNIARLQGMQNVSDTKVAKAITVCRSKIRKVRDGEIWDLELFSRLARYFNTTVDELKSLAYLKKLEEISNTRPLHLIDIHMRKAIVGKNITLLQQIQGLKNHEVLKKAELPKTTYGHYKNGDDCAPEKLAKIARVFGVPYEKIISPEFTGELEKQLAAKKEQIPDKDPLSAIYTPRGRYVILGKNIASLQMQQKITDRQAADKCSLKKTTYQNHKLGKKCSPEVVAKIAQFYGVNPEELSSEIKISFHDSLRDRVSFAGAADKESR